MSVATEEAIIQQFEVEPGAQLSVSTVSGSIAVRVVPGSQIMMRAIKRGRERDVENTRIDTSVEGNRVTIRTRPEESGWLNGLNKSVCSVHFELDVPPDCRVEARGVSAGITLAGPLTDVKAETVSGSIEAEHVTGDTALSTVSGRIEARRVEGSLRVHTTSGRVQIDDSRLSDFNCHTVSGALSIETPLASGRHYLAHTVSGGLDLLVPEGTAATVQLKSVSGSVSSEVPAEIIRSGRRHWQGRLNGGGANVEMSTVSGDLRIGVSADLPAAERTGENNGAGGAAGGQDATAVLEELERGDITVEQALQRLKGLR